LLGKVSERKKFDVGVITVLPEELKAVLAALGGRPEDIDHEDLRLGPERYWIKTIKRDDKRSLSVLVTFVGKSRNVPCAIATERLLQRFSVTALILVGIAAGLREKKYFSAMLFVRNALLIMNTSVKN